MQKGAFFCTCSNIVTLLYTKSYPEELDINIRSIYNYNTCQYGRLDGKLAQCFPGSVCGCAKVQPLASHEPLQIQIQPKNHR